MDSSVILTLDELEKMLVDATNAIRCALGTCGSCGCGMIHELFYVCNRHYSLMKSNSYLSMN